jgi:hypothetical protein
MPTKAPLLVSVLLALSCQSAKTPESTPETLTSIPIGGLHDKVDLLFMIDNSPSMAPKQTELRARFPELLQKFQALASAGNPVSYHIGVVTSDLGAGPYVLGSGQCRPGGDNGALQKLGAAADESCAPPTGSANFIDYDQINGTDNLPAGQDLPTTFACMASVGDKGCGFEQPLESVYLALHDPPAANAGFLRPDALLVVVFLTDEDDCSIPPGSDLFDPSKTGDYGPLLSYRCSNYGIACGTPGTLLPYGSSGGPLTDCHAATPAEGGLLTDVQRYVDYFSKPGSAGGVKIDPTDVILATLSAPETPVESLLANPQLTPPGPYEPCTGPLATTCAVTLQHSCVSPSNSSFFGDPAVRLRQVVSSAYASHNTSICDGSYSTAMQSLGTLMSARVTSLGCLPRAPLDAQHPHCEVDNDVFHDDGSVETTPLSSCTDGAAPCWRIESGASCPSGYRLSIDLGGATRPSGTRSHGACALAAP